MAAKLKEIIEENGVIEDKLVLDTNPGVLLKEARLARKLNTQDISKALRISERYIQAIEEQDLLNLPEAVYTLGFVRSYALYLELDAPSLVMQVKKMMKLNKQTVYDFPMPEKTSSVPKISLIIGSLLAIVGIYVLWAWSTPETKSERITKIEAPAVVPPIKTPVIDEIVKPAPLPLVAPKVAEVNNSIVSLEDFFVVPGQELIVKATQLSWVEIIDQDGNTLLNATLKPGESKTIMVTHGVTISTGNAGGIYLSTGNHQTKVLGTNGQVLHYLEVPFKVLS